MPTSAAQRAGVEHLTTVRQAYNRLAACVLEMYAMNDANSEANGLAESCLAEEIEGVDSRRIENHANRYLAV